MLIADNIVTGNTATYGAGINLLGARFAVVRNNLIVDNHATSTAVASISPTATPIAQ